jgi:FAD/FMN-containing dehydrogenase
MDKRTSPFSAIAWHHCHGTPTRVPIGDTPFGIREEHFMVDLVAAWDSDSQSNSAAHWQWVRDLSHAVAPMALAGGYPNMLGPDAHDQIRYAYGSNLPRLQKAKQTFDPDGIFTSATPLPLESEA